MNCRDAREQLDAARPGPADRERSEFAAAMRHVAECAGCRDVVRDRERFDRHVGRVMQNVAVPAGLQSRILESLRVAADAATNGERELPSSASPRGRLRTRRWILAAASAVAATLLAALAVRFWPSSSQPEPQLTLADLRQRVTLTHLSDLEPFDGNFASKPPGGIWDRPEIQIDGRARGDLPDANGYHRVALYEFRAGNGRDAVHGVLLAIPKRRLDDPPSRTMPLFEDRAENYARRPFGRTYHSFAWQTDEYVYVCFIPKDVDENSLRMLQQVVAGPNA
jgi:hypothetical protein